MRRITFFLLAVILVTALPPRSLATTYQLNFSGTGVGGSVTITYGTATDGRYLQAYQITGVSGTFSDAKLGLSNTPILGLEPLRRTAPELSNLLAPNDFSAFAVATGLGPESNGFLHYDNLFYPGGSPQTATDYLNFGGVLDIYGLLFDIGNDRVVNFWSNGVVPGSPLPNYGVAVATPSAALDYVGGVALAPTPEPSTLLLLGTGISAVIWRRRFSR